jgi:ABC1 atypical kinase-like domain
VDPEPGRYLGDLTCALDDNTTQNLMLCEDGRVGFIDFGIVGRVSRKTYNAVTELSASLATSDYEGMAEALCNMGATDEEVDKAQFGRDIERVMAKIGNMQADVTVGVARDGSAGRVGNHQYFAGARRCNRGQWIEITTGIRAPCQAEPILRSLHQNSCTQC